MNANKDEGSFWCYNINSKDYLLTYLVTTFFLASSGEGLRPSIGSTSSQDGFRSSNGPTYSPSIPNVSAENIISINQYNIYIIIHDNHQYNHTRVFRNYIHTLFSAIIKYSNTVKLSGNRVN